MLHEITMDLHDPLNMLLRAWCYTNVHVYFMLHAPNGNWNVLQDCTGCAMHVT